MLLVSQNVPSFTETMTLIMQPLAQKSATGLRLYFLQLKSYSLPVSIFSTEVQVVWYYEINDFSFYSYLYSTTERYVMGTVVFT